MASPVGVGLETGGGRYVLLELVGHGGMGEVYKAHDRQLDRVVAIKTIRADADDRSDRRLAREARLAASLDHPFICKVHELLPHGEDQALLVMEFVDGRTLKDVLRDGPMAAGEVLRIAREISEAIGVAHRTQLIHRDVKPSNVMITTHGHVKVMDFGLAKGVVGQDASTTSTVTVPGHIVGTPGYMSPEQAAGKPLDGRSDVFSFGVLLYECLTGERPFEGGTFSSPPKPLAATVPVELRALVARCLEVDRARRFPNFEAVRASLDTSTLLRLSVSPTDGPLRERSPFGRAVMIAALVIAIGAGAVAVYLWFNQQSPGGDLLLNEALVSWPTTEEFGRVSPDGSKVAFVSIERGVSRMWIRSIAGSEPQPVGAGGGPIKTPVWSDDGQKIAYLTKVGNSARIRVITTWGEEVSLPPRDDLPWRSAALVRWHGDDLYYALSGANDTRAVLWRARLNTGAFEQVTHEADGKRFFSNGLIVNLDINATATRIVFEPVAPDNGRIWVADLDGRNARALPVQPSTVVTPRWRGPGDSTIVYADNINGQFDIMEFDIRTSRSAARTTSALEEKSIDVSRSGNVIVADTLEEIAHLWAVHPDRADAPRQVTNDGRSDLAPGVGPDGRIIFNRGRGAFVGYIPTDTDVMTASWSPKGLAGSQRIIAGMGGLISADSRRLAFMRSAEGRTQLWVTPVDLSTPPVMLEERLSSPGVHIGTWQPAGQTVVWAPRQANALVYVRSTRAQEFAFELIRSELDEALRATTTVLATVPRGGSPMDQDIVRDMALSPDGATAAYVLTSRQPDRGGRIMWLSLNPSAASPRQIFHAPDGTDVSIAAWTNRGTFIAVVGSSGPGKGAGQVLELGPNGPARPPIHETGILGFTARLDTARSRLVYTASDEGVASTRILELDSSARRTLIANEIEGITFAGYAVTNDGWVIYSRKEANRNVWLFQVRNGNSTEVNRRR